MAGLLTAEDIVHIENVITVLIIVTVVLHTLARLGQYSARVPRRFVVEVRIANAIRCGEVTRQGMEGLWKRVKFSMGPGREASDNVR